MLSKTLGLFLRADTRRPRLVLALAAAIIFILPGAVPAAAQNTSLPLFTCDVASDLGRSIDPLTGETLDSVTITLGTEVITGCTGLALDSDGVVFAALTITGQATSELVTIDPETGVATSIGDTGQLIAGLAFDADGNLWAVTADTDATDPATLFTLSTATGLPAAPLAAGLALNTEGAAGEALAFNSEDEMLYHVSSNTVFEPIDITDPTAPVVGANIPFAVDVPGDVIAIQHWSGPFFLLTDFFALRIINVNGDARVLSSLDHDAKGLAFAGAAPACPPFQRLYGAANIGDRPSLFYSIDDASGDATLIGPIGFERVSGMAFDSTGVLWAGGQTVDGVNTPTLFTIDPCTGLGTASDPISLASNTSFTDMSFRPSDGQLFAFLEDGPSPDNLATVSTADGTTTALGSPGSSRGNGLAIASDDTIFHWGLNFTDLSTLDPANGAALTNTASTFPAEGTDNPRINAMDFVDGVLVGSMPNFRPAQETFLVTIDTTTAVITTVGPTQLGIDALASAAGFADLVIEKEASASVVAIGDPMFYVVTVTNIGPGDATNVVVVDDLPADFAVDTVTPDQGTCDDPADPMTCDLGDIAAGESVDIVIEGETTAGGTLTNTADVTSDNDPDLTSNTVSVDIDTGSYTVSVSPASGSGGTSTYTVTVTVTEGLITDDITLECLVLTGNLVISCAFNPATVVPGATSATSTLTVTAVKILSAQAVPPGSGPSAPLFAVWLGLPVLAFFGTLVFSGRRKQLAFALAVGLLVLAMLPLAGCNNGDEVVPVPSVGTFQVRGVIGTSVENSNTVTVTVD